MLWNCWRESVCAWVCLLIRSCVCVCVCVCCAFFFFCFNELWIASFPGQQNHDENTETSPPRRHGLIKFKRVNWLLIYFTKHKQDLGTAHNREVEILFLNWRAQINNSLIWHQYGFSSGSFSLWLISLNKQRFISEVWRPFATSN